MNKKYLLNFDLI